jgi:hypothetical protein
MKTRFFSTAAIQTKAAFGKSALNDPGKFFPEISSLSSHKNSLRLLRVHLPNAPKIEAVPDNNAE